MSSTMETYVLTLTNDNVGEKPMMTWKDIMGQRFEKLAHGCQWRTKCGYCRPAGQDCSIDVCELVRRYGV